jgi:DNA replication protein DnaC
MVKIDETIRKVAAGMQPVNGKEANDEPSGLNNLPSAGDPNCPICHGIGFYRRDLPITDPDFGKIEICRCRQEEVTRNAHRQLYQFANLESLRQYTFDSFKPEGKDGTLSQVESLSLEGAYNSCQRFAGHLDGWLLITGQYGCGKTHLAAAIANQAVSLGVPTLFLTVPDLLDWLRFAYSDPETTFEHRFDEIRTIQLLVLDDFGTENATPWAQEKLFQILNFRYLNRLPLVVTTNRDLDSIEKRIQSRLQDPELVQRIFITAPDYRNPKAMGDHSELSSLRLHLRRTFDTFDPRKSESLSSEEVHNLEYALKAARKFAELPEGWIIFTGNYATGKTHLAAAIGNYQSSKGNPPLFISVPDLMDHLRATFHPDSRETYDQRFEEIRTAPLLILDDLGGQNPSGWVREKLYQLFNYRYYSELPTVVTTSVEISKLDERLQTRILDRRLCKIVDIQVPAYNRSGDEIRKPKKTSSRKQGSMDSIS